MESLSKIIEFYKGFIVVALKKVCHLFICLEHQNVLQRSRML